MLFVNLLDYHFSKDFFLTVEIFHNGIHVPWLYIFVYEQQKGEKGHSFRAQDSRSVCAPNSSTPTLLLCLLSTRATLAGFVASSLSVFLWPICKKSKKVIKGSFGN